MLNFFKRGIELGDYLKRSKKIVINGVKFEIRKINLDDHLAGLKVILNMHELYKREKPKDKSEIVEDNVKVKAFMRDFIYAGVVHPKLTISSKPSPEDANLIHVDAITADLDLAQKLCAKIIEHSYGKKKRQKK